MRESEMEDTPHKYTVMASTSSSSSSAAAAFDSDRLRLEIKDNAFEGQKVYAMVTATDVNGACSGKGLVSHYDMYPLSIKMACYTT